MKKRIMVGAGAVLLVGGVAGGFLSVPARLSAQVLGTSVTVSSSAELMAAIMVAAPGSVIKLAPGRYENVTVRRKVEGAPIRITGPRAAVITNLVFQNAAGWRVDGVTLQGGEGRAAPSSILGSTDIQIANALLIGPTPGDDPWSEDWLALLIRNTHGVSIVGCEARHVKQIAAVYEANGLIFEGNYFHDAREGLMIRNSHGVAIRHNMFVDWQPRFDLNEHPDMIQFYTIDPPYGSSQVEISGNFLSAGLQRAVQGIFIRAESFEGGKAPLGYHRNFVIRNNVYFGSSVHGISLASVQGAVIENNTVLSSPHGFQGRTPPDTSGRTSYGWAPSILVRGRMLATVRNNIAPNFQVLGADGKQTPDTHGITQDNNLLYRPRTAGDALNPGRSFQQPLVAGSHPLGFFAVRAGSDAARRQMGADVRKVGPDAASRDLAALAAEARRLDAAAAAEPPPNLLDP